MWSNRNSVAMSVNVIGPFYVLSLVKHFLKSCLCELLSFGSPPFLYVYFKVVLVFLLYLAWGLDASGDTSYALLFCILQVTSGFELYAAFSPLVTKPDAINAINKLLRWIKVRHFVIIYLPFASFIVQPGLSKAFLVTLGQLEVFGGFLFEGLLCNDEVTVNADTLA